MHFQTITKLPILPNVIVAGAFDCGDDHHHLVVTHYDNSEQPICSGCDAHT